MVVPTVVKIVVVIDVVCLLVPEALEVVPRLKDGGAAQLKVLK